MYIIEYHRYILTPNINKNNKIIYRQIIDKSECKLEDTTNIEKLIRASEHWLEDHFGYIKIFDCDLLLAVFGNLALFKKTMKNNGVLIGL